MPLVALGAFVGDTLWYLPGRRIGDPVPDRAAASSSPPMPSSGVDRYPSPTSRFASIL
jgi:membrane protein DedA with SNARE-associated domain